MTDTVKKKEGLGEFIPNLIICVLFPFMVLYHGPKYLLNRQYVQGVAIIVIVVTAFIFVLKTFAG